MAEKTIAPFKRQTARRLRQNSTHAETLLWRRLKQLEMQGSHFRRQMPIGNYIVDFAYPAARLIIEVDGSQHGSEHGLSRDADRSAWLTAEGYRLVRVWNNDVMHDIEAVMDLIYAELYGAPNAEPRSFRHTRRKDAVRADHPTPARDARRPSPSRGG